MGFLPPLSPTDQPYGALQSNSGRTTKYSLGWGGLSVRRDMLPNGRWRDQTLLSLRPEHALLCLLYPGLVCLPGNWQSACLCTLQTPASAPKGACLELHAQQKTHENSQKGLSMWNQEGGGGRGREKEEEEEKGVAVKWPNFPNSDFRSKQHIFVLLHVNNDRSAGLPFVLVF